MRQLKETKSAIEGDTLTSEQQENTPGIEGLSRRSFLGVGSAGLATAALASLAANAQEKASTEKAEHDHSSSDPGQENKAFLNENPNSSTPPPTDHGDVVPVWYSFDLVRKRVEEGGPTGSLNVNFLPPRTSPESTCGSPQAAIASCTGTPLMNEPMCFMATPRVT
jgi:hypothetical protein